MIGFHSSALLAPLWNLKLAAKESRFLENVRTDSWSTRREAGTFFFSLPATPRKVLSIPAKNFLLFPFYCTAESFSWRRQTGGRLRDDAKSRAKIEFRADPRMNKRPSFLSRGSNFLTQFYFSPRPLCFTLSRGEEDALWKTFFFIKLCCVVKKNNFVVNNLDPWRIPLLKYIFIVRSNRRF